MAARHPLRHLRLAHALARAHRRELGVAVGVVVIPRGSPVLEPVLPLQHRHACLVGPFRSQNEARHLPRQQRARVAQRVHAQQQPPALPLHLELLQRRRDGDARPDRRLHVRTVGAARGGAFEGALEVQTRAQPLGQAELVAGFENAFVRLQGELEPSWFIMLVPLCIRQLDHRLSRGRMPACRHEACGDSHGDGSVHVADVTPGTHQLTQHLRRAAGAVIEGPHDEELSLGSAVHRIDVQDAEIEPDR